MRSARARRSAKAAWRSPTRKLAYRHYKQIFQGPRWEYLASKGATPQRVLWASTSTKNPAYPDTLYVEELIGPDTVNTMPEETIEAFQDHGCPRPSLHRGPRRCAIPLRRSGRGRRRLRRRHRDAWSARAWRSSKPPSAQLLDCLGSKAGLAGASLRCCGRGA